MIGVGGLKCFYNDAFAFFVHFSDIVAETLVRDLKIAAVTESDDLNLAGVASGLNCHVEHAFILHRQRWSRAVMFLLIAVFSAFTAGGARSALFIGGLCRFCHRLSCGCHLFL